MWCCTKGRRAFLGKCPSFLKRENKKERKRKAGNNDNDKREKSEQGKRGREEAKKKQRGRDSARKRERERGRGKEKDVGKARKKDAVVRMAAAAWLVVVVVIFGNRIYWDYTLCIFTLERELSLAVSLQSIVYLPVCLQDTPYYIQSRTVYGCHYAIP